MRTVQAVGVGCVLLVALAGCGTSSTPSPATVGASSAKAGGGSVVHVVTSAVGPHLVDAWGHSLYFFDADTPGHSNCTGSCLTYWPIDPAPTALPADPVGVTAALGVLTRPDGGHQLTIDGLPGYTYSGDTSPGMTAGQGVNASGGRWWLITPSGSPLTGAASPTATGSGHKY